MRKLLLTCVSALLVSVPAALGAGAGPGDGTLAVRDATGAITIRATGGFIGRFDRGVVRILDPIEGDGSGPLVYGCDYGETNPLPSGATSAVCGGTRVRFRLVGGRFRVQIRGTGIDLSVVGRGVVTLDGAGGHDGKYSLNGGDFRSMPDFPQTFPLSAPPAAP